MGRHRSQTTGCRVPGAGDRVGRLIGWLAVISAAVAGCTQPAPAPPAPVQPPAISRPAPDAPPAPSGAATPEAGAQEKTEVGDAGVRVDLRRDEARGGHTIARHVGRTDAQLQERLRRERIAAASTYPDLETAERIVALALAENARRVQRWVDQRGPRSNLAIRYRARDGLPTGRMLRRGDEASRDVTGAVVVLRWRDEGHYVLTSYPENPR